MDLEISTAAGTTGIMTVPKPEISTGRHHRTCRTRRKALERKYEQHSWVKQFWRGRTWPARNRIRSIEATWLHRMVMVVGYIPILGRLCDHVFDLLHLLFRRRIFGHKELAVCQKS
jgi:hypothetical protein